MDEPSARRADVAGDREIALIDGGTSLELLRRSTNKTPRHWSAEYLVTEPELVRQVHLDYIEAGARVITVNAYSATFTRMALVDAADRVPQLQRLACELALSAREAAGARGAGVRIAGCIPPLNGTYRPDRVRDHAANAQEYARLAALQAPHVDLFLCETMSTAQEAHAAVSAVAPFGKPVWVSWTLQDRGPRLRSGESLAEAAQALTGLPVQAVLVNCCPPESISLALPELLATGLPAGGYANGFVEIPQDFLPGRTREQLATRQDLGPEAYARWALEWVAAGARIVGGCCEVGPAHIALLSHALQDAGWQITSG
jgi:S-methylmethionine-dependent homocysteine/selenocysteine methylase